MYLKEIKCYGFKSFADKIDIEFGKNINGVVGPNGTGKSNIVDAVRWVLGEQSIKQLRGETNSDVIFSGSLSRKPLNSASVTLVFDNSDKTLPLDFSLVSIKRVAFRSGDNEYYINNNRCRLKDIVDLLTDSGAAKESFNIIGQGKIDEILSTKASDRRIIFEEAAGVLKYKRRKDEALRKLDRTMLNINRVNDIISELSVSLEPLKIQSLKAKEHLKIKEELKEVEVSLITGDIENINNEYQDEKLKIDNLTDEITILSNSSSGYDISLFKEKDLLKTNNDNINNKQSEILSLTKEIENIDADIRLLKERQKYQNETDKIENNILVLKENILKIENDINNINNEIEINNEKIKNYEENIKSYEEKYNLLKNKKSNLNNKQNISIKKKLDLNYKIEILEENINNNSSMPKSVKSILNNPKFNNVHNTIGNLINVTSQYSLAISTALGASSNYIVVDNKDSVKDMINYLKESNIGRATFFPIDVIKSRFVDFNILSILKSFEGYINIASRLVTYDSIYNDIIENQLGNVIVTKDIDTANEIAKTINYKYKLVTLDGQVVNVGGSITGGKKITENNIISQKYELDKNILELNSIVEEINNIDKEIKNINIEIEKIENKIYVDKTKKNEILEINNTKNNNKNKLEEEKNNINKELIDLNNITNKKSELSSLLDKYYFKKEELDKKEKELEILKINKVKFEESIKEIENEINSSNNIINKKEKELNNLNVSVNRLEVKLDNLLNILTNDYNLTFASAKEKYKLEISSEEARTKVNTLKNKLNELGIVNLGSIDEYERINDRYTFLNNQKTDLLGAKDTLLEIINEMDNIMKNKFLETFNLIQKEFQVVFKDLFKGGDAHLILTDPDNLLETGIEIKAEPPGKKLQSISLLSGGEKTFTAISLLFAILNVRSVPFCIFDEVEAALDDANVESFGNYLNTYKDKTQFIIITHKKKTMEFADILYGITMQESGVSKLVSVRLEDVKKNN